MKKIRVFLVVVFALSLFLVNPVAFAYKACSDTYANGCHVGTHCDFYDDETDEWIGSMTIEYQC